MRILLSLAWGIVMYALMYLLWNGFVLYGFTMGILPRALALLFLVAIATIAGRSLRFSTARDIAPYSVVWMIIVALLDAVYTVPFAGWGIYGDWNIWVGYFLVAIVPLFAPYLGRRQSD